MGAIRWTRRVVLALSALVCFVGIGSVLLLGAAERAGYMSLSMLTSSMHPVINPGDLVIDKKVNPASIHVGDVITFNDPLESSRIVSHRVVQVLETNGKPSFKTKGDANPVADPWTVTYTTPQALRVAHVLRHAGTYLIDIRSQSARRAMAAAVFLLTLSLLYPALSAGRSEERAETSSDHDGAAAPEPVTA